MIAADQTVTRPFSLHAQGGLLRMRHALHGVCSIYILGLYKFVDRPVLHPTREHRTLLIAKRDTNQRKDAQWRNQSR